MWRTAACFDARRSTVLAWAVNIAPARDAGDLSAVTSEPEMPGASRPAAAAVGSEEGPYEPKVQTTAVTVAQWLQVWMRMCADGDLILGPLTDEQRTREVYDFSGGQFARYPQCRVVGLARATGKRSWCRTPGRFRRDGVTAQTTGTGGQLPVPSSEAQARGCARVTTYWSFGRLRAPAPIPVLTFRPCVGKNPGRPAVNGKRHKWCGVGVSQFACG